MIEHHTLKNVHFEKNGPKDKKHNLHCMTIFHDCALKIEAGETARTVKLILKTRSVNDNYETC